MINPDHQQSSSEAASVCVMFPRATPLSHEKEYVFGSLKAKSL